MRTIASILLAGLIVAVPLRAADQPKIPPPEERAAKLTEKMKETLGLTAEQEPKVHAINLTAAKAMDAAVANGSGRQAKAQGARDAQKQRDKDLKGVLTADQWAKYSKLKGELKEEARAHAKNAKPKNGKPKNAY